MMSQSPYAFESKPRAVGVRRKYREPASEDADLMATNNIMSDRRVIRGNTYALSKVLQSKTEPLPGAPIGGMRPPGSTGGGVAFGTHIPGAPMPTRPLPGRMNRTAAPGGGGQTEKAPWIPRDEQSIFNVKAHISQRVEPLDLTPHLIEQVKPKGPEVDEAEEPVEGWTQTDEFRERPPPPQFLAVKRGVDRSTQILAEDGLFDFDREVEPLLAVLVGKTLEQSLMEVHHEEELQAIHQQLQKFAQDDVVENQRVKELERKALKIWQEKERIKKKELARYRREETFRKKVLSREFMKEVLPIVQNDMLKALESHDSWELTVVKEVRDQFLPWLLQGVEAQVDLTRATKETVEGLVGSVFPLQGAAVRLREEALARQRRKRAREAALKKEGLLTVTVHGPSIGIMDQQSILVTIPVLAADTPAILDQKIMEWFKQQGQDVAVPPGGWLRLAHNGKVMDRNTCLLDAAVPENGTIEVMSVIDSNGIPMTLDSSRPTTAASSFAASRSQSLEEGQDEDDEFDEGKEEEEEEG